MACGIIPTPACIAESVAGSVLSTISTGIVSAITAAFGKIIVLTLTFWTDI